MAVLATPPPAAEPPTGLISVIEFMGLPIGLSALNQRNDGADEQGARLDDLLEHAASARLANPDHVARKDFRLAVGAAQNCAEVVKRDHLIATNRPKDYTIAHTCDYARSIHARARLTQHAYADDRD